MPNPRADEITYRLILHEHLGEGLAELLLRSK